MPAQSPTLSPTLSAIVAGLRGSSSGIPASTFPTRSAPTSARLGEDAAAESREHRDQRAAEAEPDERVDRRLGAVVEDRGQQPVVAGDAEQRQPDDEHAGDRPAAERDAQRRRDAAARGLGHARVRADRDVHPDVARRAGEDAADREPAGDRDVLHEDQRDEQHHPDDRDRRVLAVEVRLGAFLHRPRDALHPLVARRQRQQGARGHEAVCHGTGGANEGDDDPMVRQKAAQQKSSAV